MDERAPTRELADRRRHPRFPIDVCARLFLPVLGSELTCRLIELSLDGCRVKTDREYYGGLETRLELCFTSRSVSFRLCGVTQWCTGKTEVGIRFVGLNDRRQAELADLLAEIEADLKTSAEKEAGERIAAEQAVCAARAEVERLELELAAKIRSEDAARRAAEAAAQERLQVSRLLEQTRAAQAAAEKVCCDLAAREAARREALASCQVPEIESTADGSIPDSPAPVAETSSTPPVSPAAPGQNHIPAASRQENTSPSSGETPAPAPSAAPHHTRRDRRQETRHAVDCHAVIFLLDVRSQITARVLDISPSGCRMRCAEKFPVGIYRRVEVEFVLDGLPFRLPGVVQSIHDRFTTGIRFLDVSQRRKEQLMQVIDEISEIRREAAAAPQPSAGG